MAWEHDEYNDAFEALKLLAKAKMVMNYHKGDISACSYDQIFSMMRSEIEELEEAVVVGDTIDIIEEAGDVFNFLVALVHKQITEYRNRK